MRRAFKIAALAAALGTYGTAGHAATEVLTNGSLDSAVAPLSWTSAEFITGEPGTPINLTEQIGFANSPNDGGTPAYGVWVKARSGNIDAFEGQNKKINYTLSQTVAGTAGQNYTLTGDAFMAIGYSGSSAFLDPASPSDPGGTGTVPSPTQTTYKMEFLNASNAVLGAPLVADLRAAGIFDDWSTHTLAGVAPAGTTQVRVTASALDVVDNFGGQDLYFDNFNLQRGVSPVVNRLNNGNLNSPGQPLGWTLNEAPEGNDTGSFIGFAQHVTPEAPTGQGLWLRAFAEGDAVMTQTVPGVAAGNYTFSAWARWEPNFAGQIADNPGNPSAPENLDNTFMKLEFLNGSNAVIGTSSLSLSSQAAPNAPAYQPADDLWYQHTLNALAPAGTTSIKVTVGATGMFNSPLNSQKQSAFWDDMSLQLAGQAGDYDGNGFVDGKDVLIVQRGLGTTYTATDMQAVRANFGAGAGIAAAGAVPEPATALGTAILALVGVGLRRRRG